MSLQSEQAASVQSMLRGLPAAWKQLLREGIGLDVTAADLDGALRGKAVIDRSRSGFDDLSPAVTLIVEPGDPALSAIYHAFASPRVAPAAGDGVWWPSPEDLDLLENWITCLKPLDPVQMPAGAVIGVFAYEYRPSGMTPHGKHADIVYGRTGISRIGQAEAVWDGAARAWGSRSHGDGNLFATMPARYAAFIAVPHPAGAGISLLGKRQEGDDKRVFHLPVRKLVPGEMFNGAPLELRFREYHRREKLRRLFLNGGYATTANIQTWPYLRDSLTPGDQASGAARSPERLVDMTSLGAAVAVSAPAAPLVRLARQPDGKVAVLPDVPKRSVLHNGNLAVNREASSLRTNTGALATIEDAIVAGVLDRNENVRPRNAPEFTNIRHKVDPKQAAPIDLGAVLGADFRDVVNEGGYDAALYEDSVCDGVVDVEVPALAHLGPVKAAFSVVTAPDFFPLAAELDIQNWVDLVDHGDEHRQFSAGTPNPLCNGRLPPNQTLRSPAGTGTAFAPSEDTVVAVVSRAPATQSAALAPAPRQGAVPPRTTYLTDGASDIFAPGWDVTFSEANGVQFYTTYGLGSPFPEDAKLCAADNGFWPAASPDAARTFQHGPTAIPLLDAELGWHPQNPRKPAGEKESWGWDGEQGPFITATNEVNFCDFWRSDYVSNVLAGRFGSSLLGQVDSAEMIARMDALRLCIQALPGEHVVAKTDLWLVHAEHATVPSSAGAPAS
ncbi:MAG: hypothetical protein ABWY00_14525, partial [Dongiaceae bacterium]